MSINTEDAVKGRNINGAKPLRAPRARRPLMLREALMTVEQWAQMPEVKPPYELIDGRLVQKMVTLNEHDWAAAEFTTQCRMWARESGWRFFSQGAGTQLDIFNGFIPDVMGFAPDVVLAAAATYNPPPFIAVEVLFRGTSKKDRTDKLKTYERAGVHLYVLVDLKQKMLEVHRLKNKKYGAPDLLRNTDVWQPQELAGLQLELARLWF